MKILLAGLGYVGSCLSSLLCEHEVWGVSRTEPSRPLPGVRWSSADVATGRGLERIPPVEQICVALSPDERSADAYRRAYPAAVSSLLSAFPGARLLLVSSTSVYAQEDGEWVDEESPAEASTETAEQIRKAEVLALERSPKCCIFRASGIYGPGRTSTAARLARTAPEDAADDVFTNRIHRDDLCRALHFLVQSPNESGIFVASDLLPATPRDMATWLKEHHAERFLVAPPARAGEERSRKHRRMRPERLVSLGFSFNYPTFREGYGAILDGIERPGESVQS